MNSNPILIVSGEPNSVFLELFFKIFKKNKINSPIILISSKKLINLQMKKLGFKNKIRLLSINKLKFYKLDNKVINLICHLMSSHKQYPRIQMQTHRYNKVKVYSHNLDLLVS